VRDPRRCYLVRASAKASGPWTSVVSARLLTWLNLLCIHILHFDHDLQITVSIGLAHDQPDHPRTDLHELLARADAAVYEAKASGRDRVQTG